MDVQYGSVVTKGNVHYHSCLIQQMLSFDSNLHLFHSVDIMIARKCRKVLLVLTYLYFQTPVSPTLLTSFVVLRTQSICFVIEVECDINNQLILLSASESSQSWDSRKCQFYWHILIFEIFFLPKTRLDFFHLGIHQTLHYAWKVSIYQCIGKLGVQRFHYMVLLMIYLDFQTDVSP